MLEIFEIFEIFENFELFNFEIFLNFSKNGIVPYRTVSYRIVPYRTVSYRIVPVRWEGLGFLGFFENFGFYFLKGASGLRPPAPPPAGTR